MELKETPIEHKIKKEPELRTKKEINKVIRRQSTKDVQKSKAFKIKNRMEQQKNKKKAYKKKILDNKSKKTSKNNKNTKRFN